MPVDNVMRLLGASLARRLGKNDGIAFGFAEARLKPDLFTMFENPFRTSSEVFGVLRLCRHARKANVIAQFTNEALVIVL